MVIAPSLCNKIIKKEFVIKHMEDIQDRLSMGDGLGDFLSMFMGCENYCVD